MKSRVWGGIFIIAGTTLGAGMLAFPIVGLRVGVSASFSIMLFYWLYMLITAILAAEVVIRSGSLATIPEIAGKVLGPGWSYVGAIALLLLFGSLMVAYTVSGASILKNVLGDLIPLSQGGCMVLMAGIFGPVIVGKIPALDKINRHLFFLMIVALGLMSVIIWGSPPPAVMVRPYTPRFSDLAAVIPVLFTTFGFQGSIPVIIKYVGTRRRDVWLTFGLGSFIPLLVYILWQHVALDGLSADAYIQARELEIDNVGPFLKLLKETALENSSDTVGILFSASAQTFAFFAIVTSYIGVGLTLKDYAHNVLAKTPVFATSLRQFLVISGVPLMAALVYPHAFIGALGFAGLMLLVLAVILPSMIYMKIPGRKVSITILWACVLLIGISVGAAEISSLLGK
ncbi:MAG: hypothetical protein H6849_01500 [Alphaproteobacteria bacterium]|nr:MAG: hypothetical protein H6849_01500 [Alphaproteobacteria bacterium]